MKMMSDKNDIKSKMSVYIVDRSYALCTVIYDMFKEMGYLAADADPIVPLVMTGCEGDLR